MFWAGESVQHVKFIGVYLNQNKLVLFLSVAGNIATWKKNLSKGPDLSA